MKKYYIYQNNQQQGPFSTEELSNMNISPETLVWAEGMVDWTRTSLVNELNYLFRSPPPSNTRPGKESYQQSHQQYGRQQSYQQPKKKSVGKVVGIIVGIIAIIIVGILLIYLVSP